MGEANNTAKDTFFLVSFSDFPQLQLILFVLILLMYIISVTGNCAIIVLVKVDPSLHTPMYFFISAFATLEILFVSVTVPRLLSSLISTSNSISFIVCFAQLYAFNALGVTECCLLAVIAFDRDLAINNPLRYSAIMTREFCVWLAILPWIGGFSIGLIPIIFTASLNFCGSHEINHFYCDLSALQTLSCSSTLVGNVVTSFITALAGLVPFLIIIGFYIHIIVTVFKMKSAESKQKALSTCSSHLVVVSLFYGTVIIMYIRPRFSHYDKFLALIYTVIIPLLNPFIYTLRNRDVKGAIMRANL
ncbi:olfactory receptor 5AN6-like [Pelobates fuscus]|uniref:olfactory receptor 5AN6-like n=1 Tax=Pelobates fuscus TaxID=191477 RepID=UPI002FE4916B